MCNEMLKLRNWLDEHDISWEDESYNFQSFFIHRTHFWIGKKKFSVINGYGTYGGVDYKGVNQNLLELWTFKGEPRGWLTAEDVITIIEDLINGK